MSPRVLPALLLLNVLLVWHVFGCGREDLAPDGAVSCDALSACGEQLLPCRDSQTCAAQAKERVASIDRWDPRFVTLGVSPDEAWSRFGTVGSEAAEARSPGGFAFCAAEDVRLDDLLPWRGAASIEAGENRGRPVADLPGRCGNELETLSWRLVNCERITHGIEPLGCDLRLVDVARAHADDMRVNDYFKHHGLDGRSPFDRLFDAHLDYVSAGENLARFSPGSNVAEAAHFGWMDSSAHRNNILSEGFTHAGTGVSVDATWVRFAQLFLHPDSGDES